MRPRVLPSNLANHHACPKDCRQTSDHSAITTPRGAEPDRAAAPVCVAEARFGSMPDDPRADQTSFDRRGLHSCIAELTGPKDERISMEAILLPHRMEFIGCGGRCRSARGALD